MTIFTQKWNHLQIIQRGYCGLIQSMFQSPKDSIFYKCAFDQYLLDTHRGNKVIVLNFKFQTEYGEIFYNQGTILQCSRGNQIILLNCNFLSWNDIILNINQWLCSLS
ncbi:unnamed protein product [Paramecium pentaurelia]|uniref:Uncharacterized protein n=1 Tax=Paramecium pentaurelia TaxID=43138 RepID=A0A8S1VV05_9CILI|nr:unnamed protein product [Paramecium pentaurelia]